ncbi:MAG: hypothetical protein H6766_01630 [Candidatus Peribacteria bacterium]|nr:MAG: hypothetical protein H6766_01630 [Candidatus Peribacteria bacterium]
MSGHVTVCDTDTTHCQVLEEDYLDIGTTTDAVCNKDTFVIESGFFVLGDNRGGSTDSRCCFGTECSDNSIYTVEKDNIIGKASLRLLPMSDMRTF